MSRPVIAGTGGGSGAEQAAAIVGRRYRLSDHYEVGREKIRDFARSLHDFHPAHYREADAKDSGYHGLVAPVTFATAILGAIAQHGLFHQLLPGYDLSQVLHTYQRIEVWRPVCAGDRLVCLIGLDSFRQVHGQDAFVFATDIADQDGVAVQTSWATLVARTGGRLDERLARAVEHVIAHDESGDRLAAIAVPRSPAAGPPRRPSSADEFTPRPHRRFADVRVGDELPRRVVRLTRGDLVNYAGVSGDTNPIHFSDRIAGLVGLDNVVAHGMLTMGIGAGFVTSWTGDPGAITEHCIRFTSPVFVPAHEPASIQFDGRVKSLDQSSRTATIAIRATSAGRRIFGRAHTTARLA